MKATGRVREEPMFHFRIDRVRFLDNGGVKSGLGIFGHDFAKVKFLSFVTRSDQSVPELDEWMQNNDAQAKKATRQRSKPTCATAPLIVDRAARLKSYRWRWA